MRLGTSFVAVAAVGFLLGAPVAPVASSLPNQRVASGRDKVSSPSLADFDVRTAATIARAPEPGTSSKAMAAALPGGTVRVDWSPLTGGPRSFVPVTGTLTEPSVGRPADIAERFIRDHQAMYHLADDDIAQLRLVREYVTQDLGVTHLTFVQEVSGKRVIGADFRCAVDGRGRIVWAAGELVPSALRGLEKRSGWVLDAAAGALAAATSINASATVESVATKGGSAGESTVELGQAFTRPAEMRQVVFPIARGEIRPAWNALLYERGPGNVYAVTIDAENGKLLARHNLTQYLGDPKLAKFRVFTEDSPQPDLPHVSFGPKASDRELVGLPSGTLEVSPSGWVGSSPVTAGNNVRAQEDRDHNNGGGETGTATDDFLFDASLDFPIKTNSPNTQAAIVNLFYWNNYMHDYLYRLGFDEASGNFQATNVTGNGRGNDPVNADAQDGSGTNNANFSTPVDGQSPRMQMYLWDGGFDGDFDQTVILHEYTHGLSTRLIGGPDYVDGLTGPQSAGMGEGWSDWYALTVLSSPDDDVDGEYVVGGYVTRDFGAGVRHFPYSTSMRTNPLTYSEIDPSTGVTFGDPTEAHNVGEVWCSALWEVRANFIRQYGYDQGKALVERLVTDGMKFTANNPSFVDGRNGILVADQVRTGGQNQCLIWQGFAKRGVGYSAFTLNGSATSVAEANDLPPWCESAGRPSLDQTSYAEDDTTITIHVGDSDLAGSSTTDAVLSSTSGDRESVSLAQVDHVPGLFSATLPLDRGGVTTGNGTLDVALGDTITLSYDDASTGTAATAKARVVRRVSLMHDDLEAGTANWKANRFALTTESSASPSHSWTDSPGAQYADESVYRLQLKSKFDLSNDVGSRLVFDQQFDTEPGYDLCIVEAKAKGSKVWRTLAVYSGSQPDYETATVDLSEFDGKSGVKIRFSLISDQLVHSDGWHIDDVQVQTGQTQ